MGFKNELDWLAFPSLFSTPLYLSFYSFLVSVSPPFALLTSVPVIYKGSVFFITLLMYC